MPYVTAEICGGIGNRLFQIAAILGYAEKHGHIPVIVRPWILENSHRGPNTILDYFPDISVLEHNDVTWTTIKEDSPFMYMDLPYVNGNVKLGGYFQSEKYFPSTPIRPAILENSIVPPNTVFLHVRRGDYLSPYNRHHCVNLLTYYHRALSILDPSTMIFVCSDDMPWCRQELPRIYNGIVQQHRWIFMELSDTDTLRAMRQCIGGICANSTFSWWGAYFSQRREVYMPDIWGFPPLPPAVDIYPSWATKLPVKN
jgi:hypothetical protein